MSTDSESFGSKLERFLFSLRLDVQLPTDFEAMDTYSRPDVKAVIHNFCERFYTGAHLRTAVWGINPGRFGAGVTGIPFTDPTTLTSLGIESAINGRRELSAEFIGLVIDAYGGPHTFYNKFYLGAVCPIGFVAKNKNINFYDDPELERNIAPFNQECIRTIARFGLRNERCIVLGTGTFKQVFEHRYREPNGYQQVTYLEHPRFVMQYRRKHLQEYVNKYVEALAG